ncbi:MAG: hypothetical protein L0K86_21790 [Actinomycetia bacterium]|nr:hypothetical protein [Actinomycetes bacterium]
MKHTIGRVRFTVVDRSNRGRRAEDPHPDPEHPREDPALHVPFHDIPGGWPCWRRAFKKSAATFYDCCLANDPDYHGASYKTAGHYAHTQLYYEVKRRVNVAARALAERVGVSHRNLSIWLVKEHNYPWRQDCSIDDLRDLLDFLSGPKIDEMAAKVPEYPEHPGRVES